MDWLAEQGYDPRYGARFLGRSIERNVATAVALVLVEGCAKPGDTIRVFVRDGAVRACLVPDAVIARD